MRDPRVDPRPGDVVVPKSGFKSPCLIASVVNVPGWLSVYVFQSFMREPVEIDYDVFVEWCRDAEVLHVAD